MNSRSISYDEGDTRPSSSSHRNPSTSRGHQRTSKSSKQSFESSSSNRRRGGRDRHRPASVSSSVQSSSQQQPTTIALFGGNGKTGRPFLRLALDAGYRVRALLPPSTAAAASSSSGADHDGDSALVADHPSLRVIYGDLDDEDQIRRVLRKSNFVVCMLNDTVASPSHNTGSGHHAPHHNHNEDYQPNVLTSFVKDRLYPLMKRTPSIQVFLFQVRRRVQFAWAGIRFANRRISGCPHRVFA